MARKRPWRGILAAAIVAFAGGLAPGCGSDDNGGMQTNSCVALQNTTSPAPLTVVARDGNSGDCGLLRVDLVVTDVTDLFGANFTVTFPSNLLSFASASETGSVLTNGSAVSVQASTPAAGQLVVGITRLGATGVNVTGGAQLLRLTFVRTGTSGNGTLGVAGQLLDSDTPPTVIPGITMSGGMVVVFQN
jgi:hypothetical protein